jgi:hypothetical protein
MPSVHPDALNACNASTAASNSESAFTCLLRVCGLDARGTPADPTSGPARECRPQFAPLQTGSSNARSNLKIWRKHEAGDRGGGDGWLGWTYDDDALLPVSLMLRDLVRGAVYKSFLTS